MALARLALKKVEQRMLASSYSSSSALFSLENKMRTNEVVKRSFATENSDRNSQDKQVSVSNEGKKNSSLFPKKQRRRWLRKNNDNDFVPALYEFFPSGLGNAMVQATDNINRLFKKLNLTPWSVSGRVKEHDEFYKLQYQVPGLTKEELKITVNDDGVLTIKGEHKEEAEDRGGDLDDVDFSSTRRYGYYNYYTTLLLPDDAKVDEIKAELKHGLLTLTIPRTQEKTNIDVKEVQID